MIRTVIITVGVSSGPADDLTDLESMKAYVLTITLNESKTSAIRSFDWQLTHALPQLRVLDITCAVGFLPSSSFHNLLLDDVSVQLPNVHVSLQYSNYASRWTSIFRHMVLLVVRTSDAVDTDDGLDDADVRNCMSSESKPSS